MTTEETSTRAAAAEAAAHGAEQSAAADESPVNRTGGPPPATGDAPRGETNFADAEAPAAPEAAPPEAAPETDKAAEYLALAQRTQADFENYRKRMTKESAVALERGIVKLAREILPALDHLDLALKSGETEAPEMVKGLRLIQDEFAAALGRVGIVGFSPQGEAFDPAEHEAVTTQPSEEAESGSVLEVYQQGYRLNGAIIRPARVVVAE